MGERFSRCWRIPKSRTVTDLSGSDEVWIMDMIYDYQDQNSPSEEYDEANRRFRRAFEGLQRHGFRLKVVHPFLVSSRRLLCPHSNGQSNGHVKDFPGDPQAVGVQT